jgi:hypothetical protein
MKGGGLLKFVLDAVFLLSVSTVAVAAELDGVRMPDTQDVAGVHLILNGLALRTYSVLHIHIYVAGLYLERRSSDPDAILSSNRPKLLRFVFVRDVDVEDVRKSWRESLKKSCHAPCHLSAEMTARFLAALPSIHKGDTVIFLFTIQGLEVFINGRLVGQIPDPDFVKVILASFIGPNPTSADVKRELLGALLGRALSTRPGSGRHGVPMVPSHQEPRQKIT